MFGFFKRAKKPERTYPGYGVMLRPSDLDKAAEKFNAEMAALRAEIDDHNAAKIQSLGELPTEANAQTESLGKQADHVQYLFDRPLYDTWYSDDDEGDVENFKKNRKSLNTYLRDALAAKDNYRSLVAEYLET